MSKGNAIGGYVRRRGRRVSPPGPPLEMAGPNWMRYSVLPSGMVMCFRIEPPRYEMPSALLLSQPFLPLPENEAGG